MLIGEDRDTVDGKPHFGIWFGQYMIVNLSIWGEEFEKDPVYQHVHGILVQKSIEKIPGGCESRKISFIVRPPVQLDTISMHGTVGIKYMVWGRAYRVMRLLRKGKKRYAKKIVCGRMRRVRVDRRY